MMRELLEISWDQIPITNLRNKCIHINPVLVGHTPVFPLVFSELQAVLEIQGFHK